MIGTIVVEDFRNLTSWKQARLVVCALLAFTESLSRRAESRKFAAEIDRLSISILDSIARAHEGRGGRSFLAKARDSINQLEVQLHHASERGHLAASDTARLARELKAVKRSLSEH